MTETITGSNADSDPSVLGKNLRHLGEKARIRAIEQFRSDVLKNWQNATEQPDGTILAEGQLADVHRLFICHEDSELDKVNRSYGRFTDFDVLDTNDSDFAEIWMEDQRFETYEARYKKATAYVRESPHRWPRLNQKPETDDTPRHQWGSALVINKNGDFEILHSDLLDYAGYPNQAIALSREDDGRFLRLKFRMRDLEFKISYSSKKPDENLVGLFVHEGLGFGLEARGVYSWWGYDRVDLVFDIVKGYPSFIRYKRDAKGQTTYDGSQMIAGQEQFQLLGRKVTIGNGRDSISLEFYKLDDPETLDFSVEVPKKHSVETLIDHNGVDVTRFAIEDEIIPDEIRRRPFQKPGDFDNIWMFADLANMMGVKVTKAIIIPENNGSSSALTETTSI